jgi:SPP1 gp7 family putative phage head morphogenesis protein
MKSADYWTKRSEQVASRQYKKADEYAIEMTREYARSLRDLEQQIETFYSKYAFNEGVSMQEARKQLSGKELRAFKMTLEEFTEKAKDNADGRWTQQLNSVYYRTRVTRFESLQLQIRHQVEMLAATKQAGTKALLGDIYEDTYHQTLFELQKGTGIGASFARIDKEGLERVLSTEFAGSNWSQRIWGDRDKLASELRTKISQAFIRGDSVERTIREVTGRMHVSRSNAERLVHTESAFFVGQATMAGYKESGIVERYEILATLDSRTSPICQSLDGKVFPLSEMEVGVNYPPLHVRCRTTTVVHFDDEIDVGERIAETDEGEMYFVPGDMTYPEWKEQFVDSPASLGSGNDGPRDGQSKLRFVQKLDKEDVPDALHHFEGAIRNAEVEHAYVIQEDGSVYHAVGAKDKVVFESREDLEKLRGSIVTHNHPSEDDEVGGSFSKDDINLLIEQQIDVLRAVDEAFDYEVQVDGSIVEISQPYDEAYRRAATLFALGEASGDMKHATMLELAKLIEGLRYERREADGE